MATPAEFFTRFPMLAVNSAKLDAMLAEDGASALAILFLWGRDCPNCDVAKHALLVAPGRFAWPDVRWLHANVYDDEEIGVRFALHGVPVFLLFRRGKTLGRITGWPGAERFLAAVERQRAGGLK